MPRNITTLAAMVEDLRLETGRSANVNFGQDEYASLVRLLQRMQDNLYWDYEWPFLKVRRDITLQAGSRYYDFPSDMNFERVFKVRTKIGNTWELLAKGISMDDYSTLDSDNDVRQDPALKWDVIDAGDGEQMEIWPLPASDDLVVRIDGFKKLSDLISDSDTCTLEPDLVVLFSAAKLLAREKSADAPEALAAANKLYNNLKRGSNRSESPTSLGGQSPTPVGRRGTIVIAPRSAG